MLVRFTKEVHCFPSSKSKCSGSIDDYIYVHDMYVPNLCVERTSHCNWVTTCFTKIYKLCTLKIIPYFKFIPQSNDLLRELQCYNTITRLWFEVGFRSVGQSDNRCTKITVTYYNFRPLRGVLFLGDACRYYPSSKEFLEVYIPQNIIMCS